MKKSLKNTYNFYFLNVFRLFTITVFLFCTSSLVHHGVHHFVMDSIGLRLRELLAHCLLSVSCVCLFVSLSVCSFVIRK